MDRMLSIAGSLLFQLFFAVALAGGVIGALFCVREWSEAAGDEVNVLPAVLLLAVSVAVVGLVGIVRFRKPSERQLDAETDLAPLRSHKALSNTIWGGLGLIIGIGATFLQIQARAKSPDDVVMIPVVLICAAVVQLFFGLWQFIRPREKSECPE